jgi:hypothetical protein
MESTGSKYWSPCLAWDLNLIQSTVAQVSAAAMKDGKDIARVDQSSCGGGEF